MKTAVIALTKNGSQMARHIASKLDADVYLKREFMDHIDTEGRIKPLDGDFGAFAGCVFNSYEALVFVMACGIVVRAIAPYLKDKRQDPAVVVTDEKGRFAISLISGHIGGANKLAESIAGLTGGSAVITTATDVNNMLAFDVFAKDNDCVIENMNDLKHISSELVNGGKVALCSDYPLDGVSRDNIIICSDSRRYKCSVVLSNRKVIESGPGKTLVIRPKNLIIGFGCKRGVSSEDVQNAVLDFLSVNNKSMLSVKCIATVDLKQDEAGLLEFCREHRLPLKIIHRDAVSKVENMFSGSDFVKEKIGVAGVAEPCAVLAGDRAELICKKTVYRGITLAMSQEEKIYHI